MSSTAPEDIPVGQDMEWGEDNNTDNPDPVQTSANVYVLCLSFEQKV